MILVKIKKNGEKGIIFYLFPVLNWKMYVSFSLWQVLSYIAFGGYFMLRSTAKYFKIVVLDRVIGPM